MPSLPSRLNLAWIDSAPCSPRRPKPTWLVFDHCRVWSPAPDPGICYGGGGLPEGRQCMRSCLNGGGGCSRQVTLINSSLTCTHSLLKHKKHHGKRVHSAPALSCSTASLTFVRTTELSGLLSMAQHVICRSLSSGRGGGGGGKSYQGAAFHTRWGGRPPPPRLCWIRGCQ